MPEKDSKSVKKEQAEDSDDDKCIASSFTKRNNKSPNIPKSQVKNQNKKVKKEEADEDSEEPISKKPSNSKTVNKGQKKKKKDDEDEKMKKKGGKSVESKDVKKKEKKVFDLPGQKRDPPEDRDPLRIFYETLHKQVPASEMAAIWMMESGLLPKDEAKKVFERKQKRGQQQKLGSPMKTVVNVKRKGTSVSVEKKSAKSPVSSSTQKKKTPDSKVATKKRKSKNDGSSEDDTDDDFVVDKKKAKKQRVS